MEISKYLFSALISFSIIGVVFFLSVIVEIILKEPNKTMEVTTVFIILIFIVQITRRKIKIPFD